MAFRDDREALRFQVRELEDELEQLNKERSALASDLSLLERSIEADAKLISGKRKVIPMVLLSSILILGIFGVMTCGGGCNPGAEMFFGSVTAVSGSAPVPEGTLCTVFVSPVTDSDSSWDAKLDILCGNRVIYGGGSLGYMECTKDGSWITHCSDPDFTPEGGDPKLEFDRGGNSIRIEEGRPAWSLEITLDPPPATPAEQG